MTFHPATKARAHRRSQTSNSAEIERSRHHEATWWIKPSYSFIAASAILLVAASPALAHGGLTGTQDVLSHYGVLVFLLAVVIVGAGVVAWVTLSPEPDEDDDDLALADERAARDSQRAKEREAAQTK